MPGWLVPALIAWGCMAVGFVVGWGLGRTEWIHRHLPPAEQPAVSTTPSHPAVSDEPPSQPLPKGRHAALTTEIPAITVTTAPPPSAGGPPTGPMLPPATELPGGFPIVKADTAQDTPVQPLRRISDQPGVPPPPPLPGGRRRSDGPRQTRRGASQLNQGKQGEFGRFGAPNAEDPDSP